LHWLDAPERVQYKLGVTVHRCMQCKAPQYLVDCCTTRRPPTSPVINVFAPPAAVSSTYDDQSHRLESVALATTLSEQVWSSDLLRRRPVFWNSLPAHLRNPSPSSDSFKPALKTHLFTEYQ